MSWILLQPDSSKGIQCYIDATFANGWNDSDCEEPSSIYSHTGYVIMFAGSHILFWQHQIIFLLDNSYWFEKIT
jgi:hypothetical protein